MSKAKPKQELTKPDKQEGVSRGSNYLSIGIDNLNGTFVVKVVNLFQDGTWEAVSETSEEGRAAAMERFKIVTAQKLFNALNNS